MGLGAALKAVVTRFNFQVEGNKLAAVNVAASRTAGRFGKAASKAEILQERMDSLFRKAGMLAGALIGGLGLKSLTSDFSRNAVEADRMAKSLGVSLEFFTGFRHALQTINIDGDETSQIIADISERIFDAGHGSKALADDFGQLGLKKKDLIEMSKDPATAIFRLADAMKEAGPGAKRTFAAMSGLGDMGKRLLPLLDKGSEGIKKLMADAKRLGVVLDENAVKQAKVFNARMVEMKARLRGARNAIAMRLLPAVNDMVGAFSTWIASTENQTKLLIALATAAGIAAVAIASMLAPKILAAFKTFGRQLAWIVKQMKALNIQMALAAIKILAIVAAIAFIGLVIEDLLAFVAGDKSVTEQLFGRSQVIIDGLLSIRDTFMDMIDSVGEAWGGFWQSIVVLASAFGIKLTTVKALLIGIAKVLFMLVAAALIVVGNIIAGILWAVGKFIALIGQAAAWIVDKLVAAVNELKNAWEDFADAFSGFFRAIEDAAFITSVRIAAFFRRAADIAKGAWQGVMSFLDKVKNKARGVTTAVKEKLGITKFGVLGGLPTEGPGGIPSARPGVTVTQSTNVGGIVINPPPGTPPREIAAEVRRQLQSPPTGPFRDLVPDTGGAGGAGPTIFD